MPLAQNIDSDFKQALREKDEVRLSTLRLLKSALKNKSIELMKKDDLDEKETLAVIQKELKKRQDSIAVFASAGRSDLADKESAEARILAAYLPPLLSEEELGGIIDKVIGQTGPNFGSAMKEVMSRVSGQADGQLVQRLLKAKLGI